MSSGDAKDVKDVKPSIGKKKAATKQTCAFLFCDRLAQYKDGYCFSHRGGVVAICQFAGCTKLTDRAAKPKGFCFSHMGNNLMRKAAVSKNTARKQKIVDDAKKEKFIKDKYIDSIAILKGYKCEGENDCSFRDKQMTNPVMKLYSPDNSEDPNKLQLLCACCYAIKTASA